jgi:thiamine biosynthesis lipoprotein
MDTVVETRVFDRDEDKAKFALERAYQEMSRLEGLLDRHSSTSEVFKVNQSAGEKAVTVSAVTLEVVSKALKIGELTNGSFDITIAPLLNLWGFGSGEEKIPTRQELSNAAAWVDYNQVDVDRGAGTVFLPWDDMELDLGGIAKGFIVDKAAELLVREGINSAYIDAGGDIRVIGSRPDESAWRIGIRHPRNRRKVIAIVEIQNSAIVTSGDYERFFLVDDVRYHHILNPGTGMPARGLISATVLAPDAFSADALSTAVFVLGLEDGMALIESLPDVEAILITEEEDIKLSSGMEGKVEIIP